MITLETMLVLDFGGNKDSVHRLDLLFDKERSKII